MWIPINIKATNLFSYSELDFDFLNKVFLINGENRDDDGQESNGAGKSVLMEAVYLAIRGDVLRGDTSIKDIIRYGAQGASFDLTLKNSGSGKLLNIKRSLYKNKSSTVNIFINGEEKTDIPTVNEANKEILDMLGISGEDLYNYYIIDDKKHESFFRMSTKKLQDIISRFSSADIIDGVNDNIDLEISNIKDEIEIVSKDKLRVEGKIEILEDKVREFDFEKVKVRYEEKIEGLSNQYQNILKRIEELKEQEEVQKDLVGVKKSELLALEDEEIDEEIDRTILVTIKGEIGEVESEIGELEEEVSEARNLLSEIDKALVDVVECPRCSHKFSFKDLEFDVSEAEENKPEIELIIEETNGSIDDLKKKVVGLREKRSKEKESISKKEDEVYEFKRKISRARSSYNSSEDSLNEIIQDIKNKNDLLKDKEDELSNLRKNKPVDDSQDLVDDIEGLVEDIDKIDLSLEKLEEDVSDLVEWKSLFKSFKTHLVNKSLVAIEGIANKYLSDMGSNISIQIDGYKMLQSGEIREKINTQILRDGVNKGSIGKFSSGEKVRAEVAVIMALQSLINMNSPTGGLDMLFLDEILNPVDGEGIWGLIKSLNKLDKTIILISHTQIKQVYENIIVATKENDESRLVYGKK